MFYVRVLSGYEERRIRSYRLELQKRITEVTTTSRSDAFFIFATLHLSKIELCDVDSL